MRTVEELLALRERDVGGAAREEVTGYGALEDLDVVDPEPGVSVYLRGDEVVLVYVGPDGLPAGLDDAMMQAAVGGEGEWLRSRQGKTAAMHVVADAGVAWSEDHGDVGFVELFPPTTLEAYLSEIYLEPPTFVQ